jgi:intraflagellar transport protein 20
VLTTSKMNATHDGVNIAFDNESKVRVLDQETFSKCQTLSEQCACFVSKIQNFSGTVETLVEVLEAQAAAIEKAKLRAIGVRNLVESEAENRTRKGKQLRAVIDERQRELHCLTKEYDSLAKVEAGQRAVLDKLTNNDS